VRRLYRHLQKETRYVSIQLGIGGWQPFPASYVEKRGYGDCKALSNYMQAMLEAVGIRSHPVLIYRGTDPPPIAPDFPSNQFNHMILAVPTAQDTLWLENTDRTAPFGHVAADIEDRNALLVTPDGGRLVRLPGSSAEQNRLMRRASIPVQPSGDATASVRTVLTGNQQDARRRQLTQAAAEERRDWLRDRLAIPNVSIEAADFSSLDRYRDTLRLSYTLSLPSYASTTGPRLFLPLSVSSSTRVPAAMDRERTQPVDLSSYPFVDTDTVTYSLPDGYTVEAIPDSVNVSTSFAQYEAAARTTENGNLVYRRRLAIRRKTLPPERYDDFRAFLKRVVQADGAQAVLVQSQ
jgi:hypothetical protein